MKKSMYLKTQHSHAQKYGNFNDMQSILIFVDPIKIKYTQVSAYSLTLCFWRWITHLGTNLSNDYHVRTLLKGYYNILGTIELKWSFLRHYNFEPENHVIPALGVMQYRYIHTYPYLSFLLAYYTHIYNLSWKTHPIFLHVLIYLYYIGT